MEAKEVITMIVQILIGLGVIVGALVFILRWCNKVMLRITKIEHKIDTIELQIKDLPIKIEGRIIKQFLPFAANVINSQNNPLSPEEIEEMRRLMKKLQENTITVSESDILKRLLEIEREEAERKNNSNLLLAITIALSAIALVIALSQKD